MILFRKITAGLSVALLLMLLVHQLTAGENIAGVRQITAHSPERGADLAVTVWYPAAAGGKLATLGESVFFAGTDAELNAPISSGAYPLILLSHGAGLAGTPEALSWLAVPLAKQGFIVAAPMHPGNGGVQKSAAETVKLWLRPLDVVATLNAIKQSSLFAKHIQTENVGALGLSMGGGTVLALVGAVIDPDRLAGYCDADAANSSLCDWIRTSGVDLHTIDMGQAGRKNADGRIKFAMAIDPAPVDVFESASFANISIPIEILNLGKPDEIPPSIRASEIVKTISNSVYSTIEEASHYSMFGECKPGAAKLPEYKDVGDPVCSDGSGQSRRAIHDKMIFKVVKAFSRNLKD